MVNTEFMSFTLLPTSLLLLLRLQRLLLLLLLLLLHLTMSVSTYYTKSRCAPGP